MLFPNHSSLLFYIVLMEIVGIFCYFFAELLVIFEYLNVTLQWNYGLNEEGCQYCFCVISYKF